MKKCAQQRKTILLQTFWTRILWSCQVYLVRAFMAVSRGRECKYSHQLAKGKHPQYEGKYFWAFAPRNCISSTLQEKKIILLPKSDRNYEPDVSEFWCNMKTNVAFISSIMKPLLGKQFVSCPSLIYLECDDIAELNRTLATIRPGLNSSKACILLFLSKSYCSTEPFFYESHMQKIDCIKFFHFVERNSMMIFHSFQKKYHSLHKKLLSVLSLSLNKGYFPGLKWKTETVCSVVSSNWR